MIDYKEHWVGTPKFHVAISEIVVKSYGPKVIAELNLNKGAIFYIEYERNMFKLPLVRYDNNKGPIVNSNEVYIWNSTQKNSKGNPKNTFTINPKEFSDIIERYVFK